MPKSKKFDIVSIGDCAIDSFIVVNEATLSCDMNHEHCQLGFRFGDKIPYESLITLSAGNANNVAVGMSRLGLKAGFYGTVGNDANGQIILNKLKEEKVDTKFVKVEKGSQTNSHYVLVYKGDRTILIKHQDFKYALPAGISDTNWIYLTSVGKKGLSIHSEVLELLRKHPEIKMAFNPGTFQLRLGAKKLAPLFKHTEVLFVNKEEAEGLVGENKGDVKILAEKLHKMGPKTVVITDSLKGSFCLHGNTMHKIGVYPHKPVEATGCGDAFATGFTAARILNLSIEEALRWASREGAGVATKVGPQAGLVTRNQMIKDLKSHARFKAEIL